MANVRDGTNDARLLLAARKHDCSKIEALVQAGADVNSTEENGWAPLHYVARNNCLPCTKLLLEYKADCNKRTKSGKSAAYIVAGNGHLPVLECLFTNQADLTIADNDGWLPLHRACRDGHSEVVLYLLKTYPLTVNVKTSKESGEETPLHVAAKGGHVKCMDALVQHGAEIAMDDINGTTALHVAAYNNHQNATKYLLDKGADGTVPNNQGRMPLHQASFQGHSDIVKLLVKQCSTAINAPTAEADGQWTPLHLATEKAHIECIEALVQSGARLEAKAKRHFTPLHVAVHEGQVRTLKCLLKHGANVTTTNVDDERPLQTAWKSRLRTSGDDEKRYDDIIEVLAVAESELNAREQLLRIVLT